MFSRTMGRIILSSVIAGLLIACTAQAYAASASADFFSFADPQHRWKNFDDQLYSDSYINTYNYDLAAVQVTYEDSGQELSGVLTAQNLKPHFVYQLKLQGYGSTAADVAGNTPKQVANESLGFAGRWWRETWSSSGWTGGMNVDDADYEANYQITDASSPTGLLYRYVGYMLISFFVTDGEGNAVHNFASDRSYHVLWRTLDPTTMPDMITATPEYILPAYHFSGRTWTVYPEEERNAANFPNGLFLTPGQYECQMILTEESWHNTDAYDGNWATVMGADMAFSVTSTTQPPTGTGTVSGIVTDLDTAETIAGATVSTAAASAVTDQSGNYTLTLPAGTTTLTVDAEGYESQTAAVTVVENETAMLDFVLTPVAVPTNTVTVSDITYAASGGRSADKHLTVTIGLQDQTANPVAGAQIAATLFLNGAPVLSVSGLTETNGAISATLNNAPSGTYTTTVGSIDASGLTWDGSTPENSFSK